MLLRSEANPTQIRDLRVSACAMVFVCSRPDGISILVTFKLFPTLFTVRAHGSVGEGAWNCDSGFWGACKGHTHYHPVPQLQGL